MAKKKNPEEWHLNFAKWSFDNGDKCGQTKPTIILDFGTSKSSPRSSDDPSPRERALGAFKRFHLKFGGPDAHGNKIEPPLSDLKVLVVGEGKIRRLAAMLREAQTPAFNEYLAEIPSNMGGTGAKWSRDNLQNKPKDETLDFTLDGQPPAPPRQMSHVQLEAMRRKKAGGELSLEEQRANALANAITPEAISRINESFMRRIKLREEHLGKSAEDAIQPELAPALNAPKIPSSAIATETIALPKENVLPPIDEIRQNVGLTPLENSQQLPLTGDDLLRERVTMLAQRNAAKRNDIEKPSNKDTATPDFWAETISSHTGSKNKGGRQRS